jgi:Winged helix DNA-binding domain
VPTRVLTPRHLNRALLARQLLLERVDRPITEVVEQVGGLQTQYSPSGYVGLWTRIPAFRRERLTAALEDRSIVQATLQRTTIHMVSRREFWAYSLGIRRARRAWGRRVHADVPPATTEAGAERLREALAEGPRAARELGDVASGFLGLVGLWVDLVRVPPSGTWDRRRADRLALAEAWVGPPEITEADGMRHLVRAYLRGFGPAPWGDIGRWAGVPVTDLRAAGEGIDPSATATWPGASCSTSPTPRCRTRTRPRRSASCPIGTATLLVHARRTQVLPEVHRARVFSTRNPFSVGTVLVDGAVAASWTVRDGCVIVDPVRKLAAVEAEEIETERAALEAFHR